MDQMANYTFIFQFPFNKATSDLYSENEKVMIANVNHALDTIELIISSHGFISMERVMQYFGLRPTRQCQAIIFTELGESELTYDEINQTDVLTVCFSSEMKLRHIQRQKDPALRMAESPIQPIPVKHFDADVDEDWGTGYRTSDGSTHYHAEFLQKPPKEGPKWAVQKKESSSESVTPPETSDSEEKDPT